MKVAVLGYGGIARRHLDLLREMEFDEPLEAMVIRARPIQLNDEHHWACLSHEMSDVLDFAPDCAIIASPATEHIRQARALAIAGAHLLIEKPMSVNLDGVDDLIGICKSKGLTLMVGYNMAFLDALNAFMAGARERVGERLLAVQANVGQYLPDWRPHLDYRNSVSANAERGGGVIMELSHELEYVDRLVGGTVEIFCLTRRSGLLEADVEDCADIVMKSCEGVVAQIHMNMLQKKPSRACRIFGSTGDASLDILGALASASDRNKMYRDQLTHFFQCVKGFSTPLVSGSRGRRVMELILAARESAERGVSVKV